MVKTKIKINPTRVVFWSSIYSITVMPTYYLLYKNMPFALVLFIIIENFVCYYLFEPKMMEAIVEAITWKYMILFLISCFCAFIMFVSLLFIQPALFVLVLLGEILNKQVITMRQKK
ncbi:MAG: hypothetical protein ACRCSG_01990 [Cellulosilyticaceae bacterium]